MKKTPIIKIDTIDIIKQLEDLKRNQWQRIEIDENATIWRQKQHGLFMILKHNTSKNTYTVQIGYIVRQVGDVHSWQGKKILTFLNEREAMSFCRKEMRKHAEKKEWTKFPKSEL